YVTAHRTHRYRHSFPTRRSSDLKLPDGSPNPLFTIGGVNIPRAPGVNAGNTAVIPNSDVDLSGCLAKTFFSPATDTTAGDLGFRSEEHTSELQSRSDLVCRLLLE